MPRRCHHHLTRTNRAACDVDVDQPRVLARTLAMVGRSHSRGFPEAERSVAQLVMQLLVRHPCANATTPKETAILQRCVTPAADFGRRVDEHRPRMAEEAPRSKWADETEEETGNTPIPAHRRSPTLLTLTCPSAAGRPALRGRGVGSTRMD